MSVAFYRTTAGAQRYANELKRAWPENTFNVVPNGFGFGVEVLFPDEVDAPRMRRVLVGKRPKLFDKLGGKVERAAA